MRTGSPRLALRTRIGIIHAVIAIIHQISLKRSSAYRLDIFRNKGKIHIQHISAFHFRLTINRYLRFSRTLYLPSGVQNGRYRLRGYRSHTRSRLLLRLLLGCFGSRSRNIVIIRFNHHTFTHRHRNVKPVGIFHQHYIFSPESRYNTATYFTEEAHFISYFHNFHSVF